MKFYDLGAIAVFAGLAAIVAQGQNELKTAVTECERIDKGGYFVFADPTCAAQFMDRGEPGKSDYPEDDA